MSRSYYAYPPVRPPSHNYLGMSLPNAPVLVISGPMQQQPMTPARRQARQLRTSRLADRRKRYGMVFDTDPLSGMLDDKDDDADSTWSMSRTRASRRMRNYRQMRGNTRDSSPAQEIAARYRASHAADNHNPANASSSSVTYVDGFSMGSRPRAKSGTTELTTISGPRLRYSYSRPYALDRATKEAYMMAVQASGYRYRDIPCQRPGCRHVLPTIRDLASHLVMHDIEPRESHVTGTRYNSFLDMGHSVEGRPRRRYRPSPAPYARSDRSRGKFRRYLSKLSYPCFPCHGDYGSDDDFY